jgi:hypothetical protein
VATQSDGTGKGGEIRGQAVWQGGEHRHTERFGCLRSDAFRKDRIGRQRQPGVLLGAAKRQRAAVVVADPVLHHSPVHVGNPHARPHSARVGTLDRDVAGVNRPVSRDL